MKEVFTGLVHGTSRNDVQQFYYIENAPTTSGDNYHFMLTGHHSESYSLIAFSNTATENAHRPAIGWWTSFSVFDGLKFDNTALSKNKTL